MMTTDTELTAQVRTIMADLFGIPVSELPDDASPDTFPKWTSLYQVTLVVTLEEEFDTTFSTRDLGEMTSLPAIVAVLKRNLQSLNA